MDKQTRSHGHVGYFFKLLVYKECANPAQHVRIERRNGAPSSTTEQVYTKARVSDDTWLRFPFHLYRGALLLVALYFACAMFAGVIENSKQRGATVDKVHQLSEKPHKTAQDELFETLWTGDILVMKGVKHDVTFYIPILDIETGGDTSFFIFGEAETNENMLAAKRNQYRWYWDTDLQDMVTECQTLQINEYDEFELDIWHSGAANLATLYKSYRRVQ